MEKEKIVKHNYSRDARETVVNYVLKKGENEKTYIKVFELWGTPCSTIKTWMKIYHEYGDRVWVIKQTGMPRFFT